MIWGTQIYKKSPMCVWRLPFFLIKKSTMIRKNESKIDDVYKIAKKPLGTGAYGVVSLCVHK